MVDINEASSRKNYVGMPSILHSDCSVLWQKLVLWLLKH